MELVTARAGDCAIRRWMHFDSPSCGYVDERGRNGPTCHPKSTTMELRRAACFLQLLANSSPQLELTLTNQPYNMPHALLTKLAINRDMQSLVRRCTGVHFGGWRSYRSRFHDQATRYMVRDLPQTTLSHGELK
jgi:hypothetical protein